MKKLQIIINAYFAWLLSKIDMLPEDTIRIVKQRKSECDKCILRNGNWCSSNKVVMSKDKTKLISGCGCWLPSKQFSELSEINDCPLKLWKTFDE